MRQYHFITGLPRSGSTLLASILRQNPRFHASIMSPVGQVVTDMLTAMGPHNEADTFFLPGQREWMLHGAIDGFYRGEASPVVFDNNRRWTANMAPMVHLFPDALFIALVRDPRAIVDSFERLAQASPMYPSVIYGAVSNMTVYTRANELMKPNGVVGFALDALRGALAGPYKSKIALVEYDNLASFPAETMRDLYKVLGEEPFEHDFGRIEPIPGAREFDLSINTPGLHDLKPKVVYEPRQSILPIDMFNALPHPFWRGNDPVTQSA